jgi:kynureninase
LFDIPPIAKKTHDIGALIGLDLAHGTGNVECKLDEWEVDFAVWCTYKYAEQSAYEIYALTKGTSTLVLLVSVASSLDKA